MRRLAQIADAGNAILIFPQGHHTDPADEQRGAAGAAFKPGIGKLAADLELPVLPFGLAGPERVVAPKAPESFSGLVIAGIPVKINRSPVAIAFGAPLRQEVAKRRRRSPRACRRSASTWPGRRKMRCPRHANCMAWIPDEASNRVVDEGGGPLQPGQRSIHRHAAWYRELGYTLPMYNRQKGALRRDGGRDCGERGATGEAGRDG